MQCGSETQHVTLLDAPGFFRVPRFLSLSQLSQSAPYSVLSTSEGLLNMATAIRNAQNISLQHG